MLSLPSFHKVIVVSIAPWLVEIGRLLEQLIGNLTHTHFLLLDFLSRCWLISLSDILDFVWLVVLVEEVCFRHPLQDVGSTELVDVASHLFHLARDSAVINDKCITLVGPPNPVAPLVAALAQSFVVKTSSHLAAGILQFLVLGHGLQSCF